MLQQLCRLLNNHFRIRRPSFRTTKFQMLTMSGASLLHLPTELQLLILSHLWPEEKQLLCSTCRHFHHLIPTPSTIVEHLLIELSDPNINKFTACLFCNKLIPETGFAIEARLPMGCKLCGCDMAWFVGGTFNERWEFCVEVFEAWTVSVVLQRRIGGTG